MVAHVIQEGMEAVETKLRSVVESDIELLTDASRHIIASGGKRLRPQIAIMAYLAAGGEEWHEVIPLASAIEMVHTATLVHDDINDHSLTRRGQITVHARWGRTFALLTGDYLFTKVYEMMAPYGAPYNEIMAEACIRLVEGETLQAAAAKSGEMDRETYKAIISRKTASLFDAAARMGAMLAGANELVVEALALYAHNLGLAFQMVDDILDIIGDPEKMGKPVGLDVAQHRGITAVQNGSGMVEAVAEEEVVEDPLAQLMSRLRDSGAVEIARMQAVEIAGRARAALVQVPDSPARQALYDLVDAVINREK
ncbi:MAG: polyprenyl synthetase family protein [Chloroflexi bacterium]|nr:polyprenyl synthetase family protein [Chloroflexota bacterium]